MRSRYTQLTHRSTRSRIKARTAHPRAWVGTGSTSVDRAAHSEHGHPIKSSTAQSSWDARTNAGSSTMVDSRFGFGMIPRTLSIDQSLPARSRCVKLSTGARDSAAGSLGGSAERCISAPAGPQHEVLRDDAQPHDFDMARWACGTAPLTGRPGHRRRGSSRQRQ